ncbi:CAMK family protein kinase [Tritrichomonas foetus]|uniref:CAMK family protein kinase n=1 Tax=Tritrichomonas foetus TaxID=1144522 RepID=A0A1J4JJ75_9EUKA|nr:CAMK family protein kinase [Tritrichomonas foetus]|eukprot:OHS97605.1 CAMK family protein kinase [Tritrichomonas foetus]
MGEVGEMGEIGDYALHFLLGSGVQASVFYATHKVDGSIVAIKILKKKLKPSNNENSVSDIEKTEKEITALKSISHPCIIPLLDVIEEEKRIGLVEEFAPNGSLVTLISTDGMPEDHALRIFCQILCAIDYIHNYKNIVHRDIKAENILLDASFNVKLSDFGLSHQLRSLDELMSTGCGSPQYTAPEVINGNQYSMKCDIWSAGVLLFYMTIGKLPFLSNNIQRLFQIIFAGVLNFGTKEISVDLRDLITKMIQVDPSKRISLDEIFSHSWIRKGTVPKIPQRISEETDLRQQFHDQVAAEYAKMGIDYALAMSNVQKKNHRFMATYAIVAQRVLDKMQIRASRIMPRARRSLILVKNDKFEHFDSPSKRNRVMIQNQFAKIKSRFENNDFEQK